MCVSLCGNKKGVMDIYVGISGAAEEEAWTLGAGGGGGGRVRDGRVLASLPLAVPMVRGL